MIKELTKKTQFNNPLTEKPLGYKSILAALGVCVLSFHFVSCGYMQSEMSDLTSLSKATESTELPLCQQPKIIFDSMNALDGSWDGVSPGKYNTWIINADGTGFTRLTHFSGTSAGTASSSFSPDGSQVVFQSNAPFVGNITDTPTSTTSNIWLMNIDGSSLVAITQNTAANLHSYDPHFSRDGTLLTYKSQTALNGSWNGSVAASNIWVHNLSNSSRTAITQNTVSNNASHEPFFANTSNKVIFQSFTAIDGTWDGAVPFSRNTWIFNSDGSGGVSLQQNTNAALDTRNAYFSPDDSKVVTSSLRNLSGLNNGATSNSRNIWLSNPDGSGAVALTQNTVVNKDSRWPVFSPDGTKIVFDSRTALDGTWTSAAEGSYNIWIMNIDGSGLTPLTQYSLASRDNENPLFTPDGKSIVYRSRAALNGSLTDSGTASYNIWIMNIDGTNKRPLTQNSAASLTSTYQTRQVIYQNLNNCRLE